MKTLDEIRDRLGFMNPDHYETQARFRNEAKIGAGALRPKDIDRGTGRTTRMILEALWLIQDGEPIYFVSYRPYKAMLTCMTCQMYARRLGLDHTLVQNGPDDPAYLSGKPLERVFHDPARP